MLNREKVGIRIRQVRTQQHKTLRDVESASGFSSTHISEIERGRTSPTIGALIQIAHALDTDPSFFIEERELEQVCLMSQPDRLAPDPKVFDMEGTGIQVESLSHGILGGRLQPYEIQLEPGAEGRVTVMPEPADVCIICLAGSFDLLTGDRAIRFDLEDSLHTVTGEMFGLRNSGAETTRVLLILDPGLSQT
jgi:transcriptional regulator with XRE-family HTH domain